MRGCSLFAACNNSTRAPLCAAPPNAAVGISIAPTRMCLWGYERRVSFAASLNWHLWRTQNTTHACGTPMWHTHTHIHAKLAGCQAVEQTATEIAIVTAVWRNLTASEKSKLQSNGVEPVAVPATVTATAAATAPPAGQYCGCARGRGCGRTLLCTIPSNSCRLSQLLAILIYEQSSRPHGRHSALHSSHSLSLFHSLWLCSSLVLALYTLDSTGLL